MIRNQKGSVTVEAAYVLTIILFAIGSMITVCFSLHDKALSRAVLTEAVEAGSHRSPDFPEEELLRMHEQKLGNVLCGVVPELTGDPEKEETVTGKDFRYVMKNHHIRTEKLMRTLTLREILPSEEKNEENLHE